MKYLVDIEKLRTIYFNELASRKLENPEILELKNIVYRFDKDLELNYLSVINKDKKAYVLTTEGYVKFSPIVVIKREKEIIYDGLLASMSYIKKMKNRMKSAMIDVLNKLRYSSNIMLNSIVQICGNNVCIDKVENAKHVNISNFLAESVHPELKVDYNLKILNDDEWITFDFSNVKKPAILSIRIDDNIYRKYFIEDDLLAIKIKRDTCFFVSEDETIFCI